MTRRKKLIRRILLAYLVILVPLMLVSFWVSSNTIKRLEQSAYSGVRDRVQQAGEELRLLFSNYESGGAALLQENTLRGDFWSNNVKRIKAIQTLRSIAQYDPGLQSLFIDVGGSTVYTSGGVCAKDTLLNITLALEEESAARAESALKEKQRQLTALYRRDGKTAYFLLHCLPAPNGRADVTVNYLVSADTLGRRLRSISGDMPAYVRLECADGSAAAFYITNEQTEYLRQVPGEETLRGFTTLERALGAYGARLSVWYSTEALYAPVRAGQAVSLVILTVGLLMSVGLSLLLSARRIRRLEKLADAAQGKPVSFRYEDEYAFIGGLLNHSALEIHNLSDHIQHTGEMLRHQTVMLLLSGAVKERETANSLLESSGMALSEEYFFVGGVELLDHEEKLEKLLAGMKQELACIVERNGKRFLAVIVETTERDAEGEKRREWAQGLLRTLSALGAENARIGLSQAYQETGMLNLALQEAAETLAEGEGKQRVLRFEELIGHGNGVMQLNQGQLNEFAAALRDRDEEKALTVFEAMHSRVAQCRCSAANKAYLRGCIVQTMLSALGEEEEENAAWLQSVLRLDVQQDAAFAEEMRRFLARCAAHSGKTMDWGRITDYIQAHYGDPNLSAMSVAAFVGVNRAHLGRLFKANVGKTYIEYVSFVRLEKARELLTATDLPVAEIAQRVGYCDHSSFRRKFKAQYGASVSDFRREQENDSDGGDEGKEQ